MRFVITGGSGFIGAHLVDYLCANNHEIVVVDKISNHQNTQFLQKNKNVTHYLVDFTDPEILPKIIEPDDLVIHLAAQSHVDVSFKEPHRTTLGNVLATHNLLHASLTKNAKKVLLMSTDEVYGSHEKVADIKSLDPTNPYSASKAASDMIANSYLHMHKELDINILRSNNISGPRQFIHNIIPRFSCLGLLGKTMTLHGDGSSKRRYLWVKDAVSAIFLIITGGIPGKIYHIGHPDYFSNLEIANKIGTYLNLEDHIEFVTDRIFNDTIYPFSSDEIRKDLGWKITKNLDDYLPETIEWYRENIDLYKKYFSER